jgi:hypothetical protein
LFSRKNNETWKKEKNGIAALKWEEIIKLKDDFIF